LFIIKDEFGINMWKKFLRMDESLAQILYEETI